MRTESDAAAVRAKVRTGYTRVAEGSAPLGQTSSGEARELAQRFGYRSEQLAEAPPDANLGLGCGNPTGLSSLRPGEVVLDLGCGAGFDAILAAREVGAAGRVIGVDLVPEMLEKARRNARIAGAENAEFREGAMEALPVEDASVDAVLSNCAINLSPEKDRVFREIHRVLRAGGRAVISDLVVEAPLPDGVARSVEAYIGCVAGALPRAAYIELVEAAGLRDVRIHRELGLDAVVDVDHPQVRAVVQDAGVNVTDDEIRRVLGSIRSVTFEARR
jgi:SAM-dependent methyltransferase